jgi:hypothetical protein
MAATSWTSSASSTASPWRCTAAASSISGSSGEIFAEVEATRTLFAFLRYSAARLETATESLADPRTSGFRLLDRDERTARAGLSWRPRRPWVLSLGVERTEEDFDRDVLDRSSAGTSPVAEVRFQGRRVDFHADLADRSLEARRGSLFVPYDQVTGDAVVSLRGRNRLSGTLYANRNILYSVSASYAYFTDERLGAAAALGLGRRIRTRVFAETGTDDYTAFAPDTPALQEDVAS